jgi:hypothetical protein
MDQGIVSHLGLRREPQADATGYAPYLGLSLFTLYRCNAYWDSKTHDFSPQP